MNIRHGHFQTFHGGLTFLNGRTERGAGNNTRVERVTGWPASDLDPVAVRLHGTRVITFNYDGTIVLHTGGWWTHTTASRINAYLPDGWRLERWALYRDGRKVAPFDDGVILRPDGTISPPPGRVIRQSDPLDAGALVTDHGARL